MLFTWKAFFVLKQIIFLLIKRLISNHLGPLNFDACDGSFSPNTLKETVSDELTKHR